MNSEPDNWDRHWSEIWAASDLAPATQWRTELILGLLALPNQGEGCNLLEIGCGRGAFALAFQRRYPKALYLGLDKSSEAIRQAIGLPPNIRFLCQDPTEPGHEISGHTHILCSEVLEHLDEPEKLLQAARSFLIPGGLFLATVPGGSPTAFDLHIGHRRHYSSRELEALFERCGYEALRCSGAGFPFFNLYRGALRIRGERVIQDAAGKPGFFLRLILRAFLLLFRISSLSCGLQTVGLFKLKP